jgi:hypothetical protein
MNCSWLGVELVAKALRRGACACRFALTKDAFLQAPLHAPYRTRTHVQLVVRVMLYRCMVEV